MCGGGKCASLAAGRRRRRCGVAWCSSRLCMRTGRVERRNSYLAYLGFFSLLSYMYLCDVFAVSPTPFSSLALRSRNCKHR
eukprot:2578644-Prymnesium_polylepis.2